jgi:membrane protein YdbS with pleckstrin-like domain
MKQNFRKFGEKKIKEIKIWTWAAVILPITGLAGIFFIWTFGTTELLNTSIVIGATIMFAMAVFWWWWALHSLYNLLLLWRRTEYNVAEVSMDLKEIKQAIRDFFFSKDK